MILTLIVSLLAAPKANISSSKKFSFISKNLVVSHINFPVFSVSPLPENSVTQYLLC